MPQPPILSDLLEAVNKKIPSVKAQWELYCLRRKIYNIEGKDLEIERTKHAQRDLFSIRVIDDMRAGASNCSVLEDLPDAFDAALKIAQISEPDENLSIPEPDITENISVFDENLLYLKESLPDLLLKLQRAAFADKRIKKLRNAEINITIDEKAIINSKGISLYQPFTTISSHIVAISENGQSQMAWEYRVERFFKNINIEEVGQEAARKAIMLLNPEKIKSFRGCIILHPSVACDFIELIAQSLSAENYQMGKSLFIEKIGKMVINSKISIIDDGKIPERFGSTPFDSEGVSTKRKTLIEEGFLKQLMHNTYTAKRDKTFSTGNAIRTDRGLSVGPTNLYIEWKGDKMPLESLIKKVYRGVYVIEVMGMHTANPVTGDFSVGIAGIYIEKGELKHPVKEAVISGNIINLFNNILATDEDLKFYGHIGSATLLVEGIDISG